MSIKGTIFVYHNPQTHTLEVHAANCGESPGTLTHNIRKNRSEAENEARVSQHDDNTRYGHGNPVPDGSEGAPQCAVQSFPIGGAYNTGTSVSHQFDSAGWRFESVTIQPGAWLRVGFRQRAYATLEIPKAGELVEIPYEEMRPQTRGAMEHYGSGVYRALGWNPAPLARDGRHVPAQLQAVLASREPHQVSGVARIRPVEDPDAPGKLAGWQVAFENHATGPTFPGQTTGFTATAVLVNAKGKGDKNAGLGLESMACPAGGSTAVQFIKAGASYGVTAKPYANVRLGIRGWSEHSTKLPALEDGELTVQLRDFTKTGADRQSDFFDGPGLRAKMGAKKGRIDFFEHGVRINDQLPDTIYTGHEAFIRAEFKEPPRLTVRRLKPSKRFPKGGFRIKLKNELPDADHLGPIGFTAQLKRAEGNQLVGDENVLRPVACGPAEREHAWELPYGAMFAGMKLESGAELQVDTGPLGWRGRITLPEAGTILDTSRNSEVLESTWALRETDYLRAGLYPKDAG